MNEWRWIASSRIGTSHQRLGTRKQDAFKCFLAPSQAPIICAVISDGAGSAEFGGQGASIVCRYLSLELKNHFKATDALPSSDDIWKWLDKVRDCLGNAAKVRDIRRQSFASTLVMLISSGERSIVAHVGDGAIVARNNSGEWVSLSWPETGEYASTTFFVTDDPIPRLRVTEITEAYNGYAIFSDGIENIALDHNGLVPFQPFFNAMMKSLDISSVKGHNTTLSAALGAFLDGERICSRTDDDKSLILISSI